METPPPLEEQPGSNERSPAEQILHLEQMSLLVQETGFTQTAEMKSLRSNPIQWKEEVEKATEGLHKDKNDISNGMKLHIGVLLELASIYYEQRNPDSYFENIDAAADLAESAGFQDLLQKIKDLG